MTLRKRSPTKISTADTSAMSKVGTADGKISVMVKSEYSGRKERKARVSEGLEGKRDDLNDPYVVWRRRVYPLCNPTELCVTMN